MAIKTYPLNDIDYQAEDAELFHCTRTSGVYASGHFPVSVTGTDNNITIGKGIGWIKNTEFSGKVFASKDETTLNAGVPDASLPRVDAVVVRFDANQNETYFTIKQGSTGSTPTPPEVERGEYIYELHLYHIRRRPGATAITPGDITDLRMDANYCGLMADSVTQVDMNAINAQVREFIADWENQIANVTDGKMIESPEYPGCYYRVNRGVKEWLNPPMMEDVEYPTTKRQEGKRVYTKLLKARMQAGSISLPGVERIVNVVAVAERVSSGEKLMFQLPAFELPPDNPRVYNLQIYYNDDTIFIQSVYAKGTYDLYVTVEYTKLEEEAAYTNVTADGDNIIVETNGDVSAQGDSLNAEMFTTVSADGGAYIRRLTINGVAYDLAVGQFGSGAPGTAYPGVPGQTYMDTDTGDLYKCVSAENGVYVWESANEATKLTAKKRYRDTFNKVSIEAVGSQIMKVSGETAGVESTEDFVILRGLYNPVLPQDAANKQYVDSKIRSGDGLGYYIATEHGVVGDGVADDSPALNALVTLVHDAGGGTIYLPKGVYMLDSPILWQSNVSLVGEGMGLAILKTRQAAGVGKGFAAIRGMTFSLDDPCTNCTFEQFTIDGSEMQITEYTSWPKGINIHSMDQCTFRDIVIQNTCATGLGVDNLRSSVVDHVVCINCGRSWSGDGTEQNVGGAGIGIGTNSMDGESLIIQNCVADGCGNYGIFLENQGHSNPTEPESHVIANNIVRNGRNHGIIVKGDANVVVADNVVFGNAGDGLAVLENNGYVTEHILFSHNLVRGNGNGFRLESDGVCRDITLSGNVFNGNNNGIVLNTNTTELSLIGNTVKGSAAGLTVRGVHTDAIVRNNALYKNTVGEIFSGSFAGDTSQNDYVLSPGPEAIAFERSSYSIPVGGALPLSVEYTPSNVSGLVTYFVDRPEVARVEGSTLVALSEGSVVVTASCGTLTASATVAVSIPADLSAYTRLNYIQSSGTQYINTGFIPGSNTRVLAKTAHDTLDPARTICGARTASMDKEFDLRCYNQFYYGSSLVTTGISNAGTVDLNKNVLRVNGTLAGVAPPEEFACEYPLYLFALNGAGTALSNTMATMKLYYLHIYDGGSVVRAMIPVRRKSDGAVGLVDGLTGTFYQNLGSGAFTGA